MAGVLAVIRQHKLKLLCVFLVLILLHVNIAERNSGLPESDSDSDDEIHDAIPYTRKHGRALQEASMAAEAEAEAEIESRSKEYGKYSYAGFDIQKIVKDEDDGVDEFKRDPSQPYSLGPKITDWDEQRSEWLKQNPDSPNFLSENKPRVMLVTGSSPKPCENPVGDHYLVKSIKNKVDYCRLHRIEVYYNMALLDAEMKCILY